MFIIFVKATLEEKYFEQVSQPRPANPHINQTSYEIEDIFRYMGSNIISSL